ncbi:hypothetical protein O181_110328, partial [Austropuccinia psidii MF-1]|nr:hypothetical protein [Austropuccinia psidii MF-1]
MLGQRLPKEGGSFHQQKSVNWKTIKQDQIQASKFFAVKVESFSSLIDSIKKAFWQNSQYRSILQDLGK